MLTKLGSGTWTYNGLGSFTGPTTITEGTLLINGTLNGTASVVVQPSGTLGGNGSISTAGAGTITLAGGSFLAPGAASSAGVLSLNTSLLDLSAPAGGSGYLQFQLGTSSDQVTLAGGALNIGANGLDLDDFTFTNAGGFGEGTYVLFDTPMSIQGVLGPNVNGTVLGLNATLGFANGAGGVDDLVLVVVPEPSVAVALLGGLAVLVGCRRRKRG